MTDCSAPQEGDDIIAVALKVLREPDPHRKAQFTQLGFELWNKGAITAEGAAGFGDRAPPNRPAREDEKVKVVSVHELPKRKKGGSLASRQALLHSLVHIESWAQDLAWDIIARFGAEPSYKLPRQFFDDFVRVAEDECRHFLLLEQRLEETGSSYGALPVHDGLWDSAAETAGSLAARLAVEHCTHEARGLDVLPQTIHRFRSNGDEASAALLENVIYAEEVSHCAAGVRWLKHLHSVAHSWQLLAAGAAEVPAGQPQEQPVARGEQKPTNRSSNAEAGGNTAAGGGAAMPEWVEEARQHPRVEEWFHALIRKHFRGHLKPPFNEEARARAGFGPEWYMPLAQPSSCPVGVASQEKGAALEEQAVK